MRLRPGLSPGPPEGAYSATPNPLAGWEGKRAREARGRERKKTGRKAGGGEVVSDAQLDRVAGWPRPALHGPTTERSHYKMMMGF